MIDALAWAIREGFAVAVTATAPLFAAAIVAALVFGLISAGLGVRDGALAQLLRAIAVLLALAALGEGIARVALEFAVQTWAGLGAGG